MSITPHSSSETTLQKERRLSGELFSRLLNAMLNWLFDLRPDHATRRMRNLFIMFLLAGFLICLIYYPLWQWAGISRRSSCTCSTRRLPVIIPANRLPNSSPSPIMH